MLKLRALAAAILVMISASLTGVPVFADTPGPPVDTSFIGDDTSVGTSLSTSGSKERAKTDGQADDDQSSAAAVDDPCWYIPVPATAGDPRLNGDDPSAGHLYIVSCPDSISVDTGKPIYQDEGFVWARDGLAPVAPPPDPALMAEEASGRMAAPNPVVHVGPDAAKLAVKIPVWLWVDQPAPITLTVAVRGLSVTVTAAMTSTTWSMGEPKDPADPAIKVPPFTCAGAGTPSPAVPDSVTRPPCGYTYIWKSLAERTHGSGTWPVTATTNWNVTWTASNGATGTLAQPLTPATTAQVTIGEWRSILVAGPGG